MSQLYLINSKTFADFEELSPNIPAKRILNCVRKMQDLDLELFLGQPLYFDLIQYLSNSGIDKVSIVNNTTTSVNGTYEDVDLTSTSGVGSGAKGTVVVANGFVTAITVTTIGAGYAIGDTLTCASSVDAVFKVLTLSLELIVADSIPPKYNELLQGATYDDRSGHTIRYEGLTPMMVYFAMSRLTESDNLRYTATGPLNIDHDNATKISKSDTVFFVQQQRSIANAHANKVEKFLLDHRGDFPLWRYNSQTKSARQAGPRIRGIDKTRFNAGGAAYNNSIDYWGINDLQY